MNEQAQELVVNEPITATPAEAFGDEAPPEQTEGGQQGQQPAQAAPAAPPQLTPEQIRDSVRAGLKEGLESTQPEKQYTPEELDSMFNVWKPSPELLQQVLAGGEEGLKALLAVRDGLSKQFGTLLQYQLELLRREMRGEMAPAVSFVSEESARRDREDFFKQHEDLREHEELTQMVFNALKGEGYQAPDKATAYKVLADRTRALLPTAGNGSGSSPTGGARTNNQSQGGSRPARLSSGSQAGGGGPSAPAAPFPGAEVFM